MDAIKNTETSPDKKLVDEIHDMSVLKTSMEDELGSAIDPLIVDMKNFLAEMEIMKRYHDDISELGNLVSKTPRAVIAAQIQNETEDLIENCELLELLEDQAKALDAISAKYDSHKQDLKKCQNLEKAAMFAIEADKETDGQIMAELLDNMKLMMLTSIQLDRQDEPKKLKAIGGLQKENKVLRKKLMIPPGAVETVSVSVSTSSPNQEAVAVATQT